MKDEKLLLEARPSWWNFFWHLVFFWLIIPLIVAFWKRAALVLRVYGDRVVLEKGVLSKNVKDIFITDIRTIDTKQSLLQRIFKIGDVMIATAGTSGYEDVAHGLPDPRGIKELIIGQRIKSKRTND
ncbi:PH domain-containing protein [candidate division TA06 bacterium]|nr:PH domain-containing protein [candidate division TA06 bacterium]